jgi:hypothetical protein
MEVRHVEQFGLTVLQPLGAGQTLALWAVPVAAGVVGNPLMAAFAAALDVAAERCGAAVFDRAHGAPPCGGQRRTMAVTESRAEVAEYIRHFQPLASHEPRSSGGHKIRDREGPDRQRVQRTGRRAHLAGGNPQIA